MNTLRISALSMLVALALLVSAHTAHASLFGVSPVTLTLTADATSALVAIKNEGTEPMRLQVTAFAWTQGPNGEVQLMPTTDVIFFPSLVSVAAGDTRNVRVGVPSTGGRERSYRIFIEELPPVHAGATSGVRVLTRMGIPVFSAPRGPAPLAHPRIASIYSGSENVGFTLMNESDGHFVARRIHVSARGDHDEAVFESEMTGWYVLSGGTRIYDVPMPRTACQHMKTLRIVAETTAGVITQTVPLTCAQGA